jgi:hypothetical protein
MDAKDHIGSSTDLASIRMRGDEAKETVKAGHGREGGGRLFSGEDAGGSEDASVNAPAIGSRAGSLPPPAVPLPGWVWLGEEGQAQWGTGGPGSHRRGR